MKVLVREGGKWLNFYTPDDFGPYVRSPKAVLSIWLGRLRRIEITEPKPKHVWYPTVEPREW